MIAGKIYLRDTVDVTDPSYSKGVWCRETYYCEPGEYVCGAEVAELSGWGERVFSSWIVLRSIYEQTEDIENLEWDHAGVMIGVDSGLAGFFDEKPDIGSDDGTWREFCDRLKNGEKTWIFEEDDLLDGRDGFVTETGIGDGGYDVEVVYSDNEDDDTVRIVAARVRFLGEEEVEEW